MPPTLFNFVAWTLLFAQGLVSIGAGQTLCIPFKSCGQHACGDSANGHGEHRTGHAGHDGCGHHVAQACGVARHRHGHHHHGHHQHDGGVDEHRHHGGDADLDRTCHDRSRHHHDDHHHHRDHHHRDHHHGLFGSCGGAHVECGCHLHVALPDAELPWRPVDAEPTGLAGPTRGLGVAPARDADQRRPMPRRPEVFLASDELRARAVTRLLV